MNRVMIFILIFISMLYMLFMCLFVNSLDCNYTIKAKVNSEFFGNGIAKGQCQFGITQYVSKFDNGVVLNTSAFSLSLYDRIIFIGAERKMLMNKRGNITDYYLDVPFLYTLRFNRISKNIVVAISPKPTTKILLLKMKGYYSMADYINRFNFE